MTQADGKDPGVEVDALRAELAATRARVAELEEWFEVAFEHAPVAMAVVSAKENRYVRVNRALEELLGQPREYILQVDPFSFLQRFTHPDDLGEDQAIFGELALGKRRWYQVQKRYLRPDGSMRWGHLFVSGAFDGNARPGLSLGALRFVVTHIFDITEQKTLQSEVARREAELRHAQRIEAIGRLAGGVAHDINNVLSVILTYSTFLRERLGIDEGTRADLEEVMKAASRATDLTRQLLAFSRMQLLEPVVLDLNEVVAGAQKMLARLLGEDITLSVVADAKQRVYADPGQIEQIVVNLGVNARDAMPDGGTLTIETADVELTAELAATHGVVPPGAYVTLVVRDTGVGMDRAIVERIFDPFFTTKEEGEGTGLGLASVHGIVEQSGGHIRVESEPGAGTRFSIYLPRTERAPEPATPPAPAPVVLGGGETVLVVEDDEQVRATMRTILRRHGYDVLEASNAGEAFLLSEQHAGAIHLLVADVVLPRVSGSELARRLVALRPGLKVLYVSGYPEGSLGQRGLMDPHVAVLAKPITPETLVRRVREVLGPGPAHMGGV